MSRDPAASLDKLVIGEASTIRQSMQLINDNWRELALVTNEGGRLVGVVTDGDIRRGLLSGLSMDAPVSAIMTR
jgi:CBS domain-containing protein